MFTKILAREALLPFLACAVFAWFTGSLLGETETDPYIVASVVPAVIAATAALIGRQVSSTKEGTLVGLSATLIVFCIVCYSTANFVRANRAEAARKAVAEEIELRREQRERHLSWCSEVQLRINSQRETVGLPPLSNASVCDY